MWSVDAKVATMAWTMAERRAETKVASMDLRVVPMIEWMAVNWVVRWAGDLDPKGRMKVRQTASCLTIR